MAKKTLEAKLRMIDETQAGARSAAAGARSVAAAFGELDKSARKAMLRVMEEREGASRTLQRQKIANLEREVMLGKQGASVELERARATAAFRREREALLAVARSEVTTARQSVQAYQQLAQTTRLYQQQMAAIGSKRAGGGMLAGAGGALLSRAAGLVGAYAGVRSVGEVGSNIGQARDDVVAFEQSLKDLLTTGENSKSIDTVRDKVLALSTAMGRSKEEIAELMFFIEGGTAGMSGQVVEDIRASVLKMGKATSTNLSSMAEAMIKSYRIFGHEVQNVDEMADKMFATVERGMLTHENMANFVVQVLSAGDAFKFKLDEMLGAVSVSTKSAGDAQQAMTAIRNIVLRLNNAEKEGIKLTGDFVSQLEQLSGIDPNKLTDMFGDRTVAVLFDLVRRTKELREEISILGNVTGTVDGKLQDLGKNGTHAMAMMITQFREAQKNMLIGMGGDGGMARFMTDFEATKLGANQGAFAVAPEWLKNARALAHKGGPATIDSYIKLASTMLEAGDEVGAKNAFERAKALNQDRVKSLGKQFLDPNDQTSAQVTELGKIFEVRREIRIAKETNAENEKAAMEAGRMARFTAARDLMGPFAKGFLEGRTADLMRDVLDDKPGAMKNIRDIRDRAALTGRRFDEQAALEPAIGEWVAKLMTKAFGRENGKASVVEQLSKSIFGEGPQTFADKVMGRQKQQSTVVPLLGGMVRDGLAGFLGAENAGFFGLGPAVKKRREAAAEKEDDLPVTASLLMATSGYTGAAERAKQADELKKLGDRLEKKMQEQVAAINKVVDVFKGLKVVNFDGLA